MFRIVMITALSALVLAASAVAQTTPPTQVAALTQASNEGAFDRMSPGNQKIAQALFDAQQNATTPTTREPLTRDDIAAMKQDSKGWGRVLKDMKGQGLIQEKNLGQVVSRESGRAGLRTPGGTSITTGSGKTFIAGTKGKPEQAGMNSGRQGENQGKVGVNSGRPHTRGDTASNLSGGAGAGHVKHGRHGKN